jgi:hypothetical protein
MLSDLSGIIDIFWPNDPWFLPPVTRQGPSAGKPGLRLDAQIELIAPPSTGIIAPVM